MGHTKDKHSAFVHLHSWSWFNFLRGGSSPSALVQQAASLGQTSLALTDWMSIAGAVQFQVAARQTGVKAIVGSEVVINGYPLVLLCASQAGYATLNRLLTDAHQTDRDNPEVSLEQLADDNQGLFILTGGVESRLRQLVTGGRYEETILWLEHLADLAPQRVFVELVAHRLEGEPRVLNQLVAMARAFDLHTVATNAARYATPDDYLTHDLLNRIRLKLRYDQGYEGQPPNDEAWLKGVDELYPLIPDPTALANTVALAAECKVNLLHNLAKQARELQKSGRAPQTDDDLWSGVKRGRDLWRLNPDELKRVDSVADAVRQGKPAWMIHAAIAFGLNAKSAQNAINWDDWQWWSGQDSLKWGAIGAGAAGGAYLIYVGGVAFVAWVSAAGAVETQVLNQGNLQTIQMIEQNIQTTGRMNAEKLFQILAALENAGLAPQKVGNLVLYQVQIENPGNVYSIHVWAMDAVKGTQSLSNLTNYLSAMESQALAAGATKIEIFGYTVVNPALTRFIGDPTLGAMIAERFGYTFETFENGLKLTKWLR